MSEFLAKFRRQVEIQKFKKHCVPEIFFSGVAWSGTIYSDDVLGTKSDTFNSPYPSSGEDMMIG